ncbi:hypothetical protein [Chryseobacterium sp.]|uniref:hypothetical protein n=1 Tax=Chryseobacterium sp. TaxID=1871047 RepID=UPI000EE7F130|nr:hypothetical protein [Chryseobacterium sp.]HCA08097.1 hypothetical protein [Chryseobacterium sp.]
MKKLLLPLVLFAVFTKAQTQQDYYNASPSGIDPVIGMKETQSESVRAVDEILKNNKPSKIGQKLEKSSEKVENLEVAKFDDVYQNTPAHENRNYNQSGNVQPSNQNSEVDPFSSPDDNRPSFQGERVNVDEHYNQQPDGGYIKKDTGYQKLNNKESDNTVLIVIILIVGAGVIGALVINQKKSTTGVSSLKDSLIQMFEENYKENYMNFSNDNTSFPIIASASLNELYSTIRGKCSFLSNQYSIDYGEVSILIDECFEKVYYKYFER